MKRTNRNSVKGRINQLKRQRKEYVRKKKRKKKREKRRRERERAERRRLERQRLERQRWEREQTEKRYEREPEENQEEFLEEEPGEWSDEELEESQEGYLEEEKPDEKESWPEEEESDKEEVWPEEEESDKEEVWPEEEESDKEEVWPEEEESDKEEVWPEEEESDREESWPEEEEPDREESWPEEEEPDREEFWPEEEESDKEEAWPEEEEESDKEESWPEEEGLEKEESWPEEEEESDREEFWSAQKPQRKTYGNRKRKKRRKRSGRYGRRRVWISRKIFDIAVLCVFLLVLYLWNRPKVVRELEVEAGGSVPELSEFLLREYKDAYFTQEWEELLDMNQVTDYEIGITIAGEEYTSLLHVTDTIAPIVEAKKVQAYQDHILEPMDFVEKIEDATETEIAFAEKPDFTIPGEQKVELIVTDEGGNVTQVSTEMEIVVDTEPPVIEGVEELTVAVGESISYKKNVTVSDNYDEDVTLEIDSSQVDLNAKGDYPVVYRAEDGAGNVTEEETVVHVKAASVETATEEMVNKRADEILEQITTEDMSQYDVAKKIFDWVHGNIGWSDGVPKTNWIQGAYRGLFDQKGDCYVYASAAKCLLTRAGIENMDIGFSSARRSHYWNLIDLGEGWYHFDATRRSDGRSFFYYKDADIRAYSSTHNGSHAYDPSQYPDIQ